MHRAPSPITRHRLARLNVWARLWLVWFVGVCAAWWSGGGRAHPRALDRVAAMVGDLIVVNASARYRPRPRRGHRHGRVKEASRRNVTGAALRRALSGKAWPSRLAAILAVVRDAEAHIARLLRRLRRGLTRLRVLLPEACAEALADAHATDMVACADTS